MEKNISKSGNLIKMEHLAKFIELIIMKIILYQEQKLLSKSQMFLSSVQKNINANWSDNHLKMQMTV